MATNIPAVGSEVITADGQLLGKVSIVAGDCFKVDKPMRPDDWLSFDTISSLEGAVRLSLTREQLEGKPEGIEHFGYHVHRET